MQGPQPLPYEEICKMIGDLQLSAYAQSLELQQARLLVQRLTSENANLRKEVQDLKDNPLCSKTIPKENI
jgi:hypothetical protein